MPTSRVKSIRTLVEAHVSTAISGVTISNEPISFETVPKDQFPFARVLFTEAEPERLAFKQERRRVTGQIALGFLSGGATPEATREVCDLALETIRDAIFADETLSATVDDVMAEAGTAYSQRDDEIVYGIIDVTTEEIF